MKEHEDDTSVAFVLPFRTYPSLPELIRALASDFDELNRGVVAMKKSQEESRRDINNLYEKGRQATALVAGASALLALAGLFFRRAS